MAKHMVKCFYCREQFDTNAEPFEKVNARRYAHTHCYNKALESKTKEEQDKEELEKYIKQLFQIDNLSPKIRKQIKTYREEYNYSYSAIRKTLIYFFEVKGNSIEKAKGGIGIVPYCIEQASNYWYDLWETKERNKEVKVEQLIIPVREIHIKPPERKPMRHFRKLFTFLDSEVSE